MIARKQLIRIIPFQRIHRKIIFGYKPSRFQEQHQILEPKFDATRRNELKYNFGLYAIVFGMAWAAVPFYKLFCEHFGLDGDVVQKDYSDISKKKMDIHRKFNLHFKSEMDPKANWEFEPVQSDVQVHAGETALIFYRAFNKEDKPIVGFSTYQIFPADASLYFAKIQCFCFNQQLLNSKEELMLPIYFYLEPEILDDPVMKQIDKITIIYSFLKSRDQNLAKLAEEELTRVKKNKMILMQMRKEKEKENGLKIQEDQFNKIKNQEFSAEELDNFCEYDYEIQLNKQSSDSKVQ